VPLHNRPEQLKTREAFPSLTKENHCMLSNLSGEDKVALYCGSITGWGCYDGPSQRITVPAYSSVDVPPLPPAKSYLSPGYRELQEKYPSVFPKDLVTSEPQALIFTKPKEVLAECVKGVTGTTSTFDVNSRITAVRNLISAEGVTCLESAI
jgi:hypothetical protein